MLLQGKSCHFLFLVDYPKARKSRVVMVSAICHTKHCREGPEGTTSQLYINVIAITLRQYFRLLIWKSCKMQIMWEDVMLCQN